MRDVYFFSEYVCSASESVNINDLLVNNRTALLTVGGHLNSHFTSNNFSKYLWSCLHMDTGKLRKIN